jgi:large repetitive protein
MELKLGQSSAINQSDEHGDASAADAMSKSRGKSTPGLKAGAVVIPANATHIVPVDGKIQLPAGTRLDSIRIAGTDLVVTLPNGEVLVIVDGALHMPQIMIGAINIPASNIAMLIAGQEPEPAAGAPQSSGGNFIEAVGDIGDPFGLGNLLPPTEFGPGVIEDKEFIPGAIDHKPELLITTPDQPAGSASATANVAEAALASRGSEPPGSDPASNAETVTGSIQINSLDGPNIITVNGTAITAVGQIVSTPLGLLTITSIAPDAIGYSYTLVDNSLNPASTDVLTITVTDHDGDVVTGTLTLIIADDAPTARSDSDAVAPGSYAAQSGNVITGAGTTSGAAGADIQGADGATVTGIRSSAGTSFATVETAITGQYGRLLINADGSYSYTRNPGTPGGVADVFTYQLTDGDGDTSTATLTINIGDSGVSLLLPSAGDDGTLVDEAGLPEREGGSAGTRDGDDSNITYGVIGFDTPDGPASIMVNGVLLTGDVQEIELPHGVLYILGVGNGGFEYSFVLTNDVNGPATETITVTITDRDGDSVTSSFNIDIVDDAPHAVADTDILVAGNFGPATGNVITDAENDGGRDTQGADGAMVSLVSGNGGSAAPGAPLEGLYGVLTLNGDGSYSYVRNSATPGGVTDVFTYTLTDSDGDSSTATLTISIRDGGVILAVPNGSADGQAVAEAGLPQGSDPGSTAATTGSFTFTVIDGPGQVFIGGTEVTAIGQIISGAFGTLTITSIGAGAIGFSYVLTEVTDGDDVSEQFAVRIVDADGDEAHGSLRIDIVDDVPTAVDDVDFVQAGNEGGADGNVLTGSGGSDPNATDGDADISGADGVIVSSVSFDGSAGTVGGQTTGAYGTLALNSDGSYRYLIDPENADIIGLDSNQTLTETFEYEITDADGDPSTATLTITVRGRDDGVTVTGLNGDGAEVTVSEANLADGTAPDDAALVRTGSFIFNAADGLANMTIGGVALFDGDIVPGLAITTDHGVLTITDFVALYDTGGDIIGGTISYSYELTDNLPLHNGALDTALTESFAIIITDSDGTVATSSLDVLILDDNPSAAADIGNVGEGQTLYADADVGLLANDVAGADDAELLGVRALGGNPSSPATVGIGAVITGLYGRLTVAADGSYTYISNPNIVPPAGASDVFVYSIRDGDGDVSTTTLTIQLSDSGLSTSPLDLAVLEAALPDGSDPDSSDESISGDLNAVVSGGTGPFTYTLTGDGVGTHGVFELNPDGTYIYTLGTAISGPAANNGPNVVNNVDSFSYTATDAFGNTTVNIVTIDVVDDVPVARAEPAITIAEDAPTISGDVFANDTMGADGATLTSVVINGVTLAISATGTTTHSNAFGSYSFDATGAWSFNPVPSSSAVALNAGFSYTITDGDGDLSTAAQIITLVDGRDPLAGAPITLTLDDENLENGTSPTTTASEPLPTTSGTIAFTTGSDPIVSIGFGSLSTLGGGLNWVFETPTQVIGWYLDIPIIQLDLTVAGTTATVVATLLTNYPFHSDTTADDLANLGFAQIVATDSDGDTAIGRVNVALSDDVPVVTPRSVTAGMLTVDETNLAVDATANFASLFAINAGADQPGTVVYSFDATLFSALIDVATGSSILLHASGNVIEGRVGSTSTVAFRLTIDSHGIATLDQIRAIRHADTANPDDSETLTATQIRLTATVTDSDGDSSSATVNVGGALVFRDDGPLIDIGAVDANGIQLTTQDADTRGAAFDVATANFSSAFTISSLFYGADGAPTVAITGWNYALAIGPSASATGLTSNGVPITLALVAGQIVGSAGATQVFSVAVNPSTGVVTLTQFAELDHPLPGSASGYDAQLIELPAGLIELRGTATIIDRDGDTTSDTAIVDLGGNIRFADDGPSVTASGVVPELTLDESFLAVDASADFSGLFATALNYGADGPGNVVYQLGVTAGPSGLIDSLSGEPVILSLVDGVIYGRTSTQEVFRISINAAGVVTFDQSRSVIHTPNSGPDQIVFLSGANLITLTAIATDGDGDTALASVDITGRFAIRDDAPLANADADNVARDGQVFADGNVLTGVGGLDDNGVDGVADSAGSDGGLRVSGISYGITSGTLGSALAGDFGSIIIAADGSYRYELDINDPAVIALNANQTLTDTFNYTVIDSDGDTATASITITITGANDFPIARADTNWVLDGLSGSDPAASGNVLQNISHPGAPSGSFADVADNDPDLEALTVTSAGTYVGLYGTLVITANGAYTYTLNEDNPAVNALDTGQSLVESFTYSVSDGSLSVNSSLSITVFGTNDAPTIGVSTARISEEGLATGIADTAPNATLDTTNSSSFSGILAIADVDIGETLTSTLGNPGSVLTVGGVAVTWAGVGTATLIGSVGAAEVIRVTLSSNGAYTVTLSHSVDHPDITLEDLRDFTIPVSVTDGTVTTTNPNAIRIVIEDDAPTATGETGASNQPAQDVNTLFILDFSDSIDNGELDTMLDAVKAALAQLDSAALGSLNIQFVIFSTGSFASPAFTSAADANAYLDLLNPLDGGVRPSQDAPPMGIGQTTNYTGAIQTALANFSAIPGSSNQVFFLSDGNPNTGTQSAGIPPVVVNSLQNATATAWNNFVDSNNVNVTAIGVDNNPLQPLNIQRLRDVDLNSAPDNEPILVADFDDLVATLLSVVVPTVVGGDLDGNDNYGADGGRILSITIGLVTYTWDGASTISLSSGGTISGTSLNAITTPMGGQLTVNLATGQYNYQPPSPITVTATEVFNYTLVDNDGDRATASLSVTITAAAPPVALDLDGDGVEFVSNEAGARFDFNGDGVAESTAWVGADDGLLVLDRNGDGLINSRSELVFAQGGLSDLQGLALNYDSNGDGRLDASDAAFASFAVWRDANSNGATEPGELQSLTEAGIASIGLVSDGRGYTAANGQVVVRGEALYSRTDGSIGRLADAAFATNFANDSQRSLLLSATGISAAMMAAGLIAVVPLAAAEPEDARLLDNAMFRVQVRGINANDEAVSVQLDPDNELWFGDFPTALGHSFTSQTGEAPDLSDDGYAAPQQPNIFDQADDTLLQNRVSGPEISEQTEQLPQTGPFEGIGGQSLGVPAPQSHGGAVATEPVTNIVANALEGRTVDLDALLGIEPAQPQFVLQSGTMDPYLGGDVGMSSTAGLFTIDLTQQQAMAQLEHAAATGHV